MPARQLWQLSWRAWLIICIQLPLLALYLDFVFNYSGRVNQSLQPISIHQPQTAAGGHEGAHSGELSTGADGGGETMYSKQDDAGLDESKQQQQKRIFVGMQPLELPLPFISQLNDYLNQEQQESGRGCERYTFDADAKAHGDGDTSTTLTTDDAHSSSSLGEVKSEWAWDQVRVVSTPVYQDVIWGRAAGAFAPFFRYIERPLGPESATSAVDAPGVDPINPYHPIPPPTQPSKLAERIHAALLDMLYSGSQGASIREAARVWRAQAACFLPNLLREVSQMRAVMRVMLVEATNPTWPPQQGGDELLRHSQAACDINQDTGLPRQWPLESGDEASGVSQPSLVQCQRAALLNELFLMFDPDASCDAAPGEDVFEPVLGYLLAVLSQAVVEAATGAFAVRTKGGWEQAQSLSHPFRVGHYGLLTAMCTGVAKMLHETGEVRHVQALVQGLTEFQSTAGKALDVVEKQFDAEMRAEGYKGNLLDAGVRWQIRYTFNSSVNVCLGGFQYGVDAYAATREAPCHLEGISLGLAVLRAEALRRQLPISASPPQTAWKEVMPQDGPAWLRSEYELDALVREFGYRQSRQHIDEWVVQQEDTPQLLSTAVSQVMSMPQGVVQRFAQLAPPMQHRIYTLVHILQKSQTLDSLMWYAENVARSRGEYKDIPDVYLLGPPEAAPSSLVTCIQESGLFSDVSARSYTIPRGAKVMQPGQLQWNVLGPLSDPNHDFTPKDIAKGNAGQLMGSVMRLQSMPKTFRSAQRMALIYLHSTDPRTLRLLVGIKEPVDRAILEINADRLNSTYQLKLHTMQELRDALPATEECMATRLWHCVGPEALEGGIHPDKFQPTGANPEPDALARIISEHIRVPSEELVTAVPLGCIASMLACEDQISQNLYALHLRRWLSLFNAGQVVVLRTSALEGAPGWQTAVLVSNTTGLYLGMQEIAALRAREGQRKEGDELGGLGKCQGHGLVDSYELYQTGYGQDIQEAAGELDAFLAPYSSLMGAIIEDFEF